MDIYAYIRKDHRKVADLMANLLTINLPYVRQQIFNDIKTELTLHAEAEEATFYTAIVELSQSDNLTIRIDHSEREHNEIRDLLQVLTDTPVSSEFWMEKLGELKHAVEHHVREEEDEIFPRAQAIISPGTARELARDMAQLKARMREEMNALDNEQVF